MVTVRATVVQASSVFYDTSAAIDKASSLVEEAVSKGARLVVFPEAFIGGHPHGVVISGRSTNGKVDFDKYQVAIDVPGPEVERIGAIARNFNVYVVMGAIERLRFHLYSTVIFFDSQGQFLGMQRKLISTPLERTLWDIVDESTIPVYETPIGKIGALISWENRMPLLRMALYDKDIQIYCALTSDAREVWQASMTHIALEGGCFVLSANQFCRRGDYPPPPDYIFDEQDNESHPDSVVCAGGSVIISPSGVVLAGPNYDGEALITADLDLDENRKAKLDFDVVGVSSRLSSLSPSRRKSRRINT